MQNEVNGRRFKEQFMRVVSENYPDLEINIKFFERDFYDLCTLSRRAKKPILLVLLREDTLDSIEDVA